MHDDTDARRSVAKGAGQTVVYDFCLWGMQCLSGRGRNVSQVPRQHDRKEAKKKKRARARSIERLAGDAENSG
jgi:hypothetical protein